MKSEMSSALPPDKVMRPARGADVLERLWTSLDSHFRTQSPVPARTARLTAGGRQKMAKKLVEEAGEAALAAAFTDRAELIAESADLLYHLAVLWASMEVAPGDVWAEMQSREAAYGLAEKRAKQPRVAPHLTAICP